MTVVLFVEDMVVAGGTSKSSDGSLVSPAGQP
jgi:hypothetical protein